MATVTSCCGEGVHHGLNGVEYCNKCRQPIIADIGPSLSLLVIDLGDCCVVKVEKGHFSGGIPNAQDGVVHGDGVTVFKTPFADLRAALEGEKPVPRIERDDIEDYRVFVKDENSEPVCRETLDALSQLCGKPLPIWEGNGRWEEIAEHRLTEKDFGAFVAGQAIRIWRYTR